MAKHLDNRDINAIVNLIRGWKEPKLSWSAICEAAENHWSESCRQDSPLMHMRQ